MKARTYFIVPLVAGAVSLSSCKKNPEATEGSVIENGVDLLEESIELVEVADKGHLSELATKAGFATMLPKETSAFWTFYDGAGMAKKLRNSKLGRFIESMAEEDDESLDDLLDDPEFMKFSEIAGEELFIAVGQGTPAQAGNLLEASTRSNYHQMRSMVGILANTLKDEEMSYEDSQEYIIDWAKDPKTHDLFKASVMPPIYFGFKLSDAEKRQGYIETLLMGVQELVESQDEQETVLEEIKAGDFKGMALRGELLIKMLSGDEGGEMREMLGEETFESFKNEAGKKDIVALVGERDDYLVFFIGSSVDQLKFAESVEDSVLANEQMAFTHQYSQKELISLMFMEQDLTKVFVENQSGLSDLALGVIDGLKESDVFGDTRVLEGLLGDLIGREKAYYAGYKAGLSAMVAYYEDGIKLESIYTGNSLDVDLKSKRQLANLSEGEGVLFSANWINNPAQTALGLEYIDVLGSTVYQMTKQLSGLEFDTGDLSQYTAGFGMIDGMLRGDLVQLWSAFRNDLAGGLGAESAVVVDINGELPTVPMIPEEIVKNGKVPRVSYLSTVKDRSKLGASWQKVNSTAERLLKQAGAMTGTAIPMQRPFKSESNGLTSWSFQIPFAHQNCTPSVSVSDDLFVIGSSSDFANQLAGNFSREAVGEPMAEMLFQFEPLRELGTNWLELLANHGGDFMGEGEFENFQEAIPMLRGLIEASDELDSISVQHTQSEKGIHSSIHIKTL